MSSPRILFVNSHSTLRCGVSEFGRTMAAELLRLGADLTIWDGSYPAIYERPYLPDDAVCYDVLHLNWHPVTLNHYRPEHLPRGPRLSLYLHDLPPWSTCDLREQATWTFAAEPHKGTIHLPYPAVADAQVHEPPIPYHRPVIGWTGVRGDGRDELLQLCRRRGWTLNDGNGGWLSTRDEILRLSLSTLNVLWYTASGRGQSLALMTAAAARRPLLINSSTMFASARGFEHEIYRAGHVPATPFLGQAIDEVLAAIGAGTARVPSTFLDDYSWSRLGQQVLRVWAATA